MDANSLLYKLYRIPSESGREGRMRMFLTYYCKRHGAVVARHKRNLYVTKGNADNFPCIVAHMDTVHDSADIELDNYKGNIGGIDKATGKSYGIGADDKNGIWLALQMMHRLPYVKLVFTHSEEIGCVGAEDIATSFFTDVGLVIQGDRQGFGGITQSLVGDACVSSACMDYVDSISTFKHKWINGGITDVHTMRKKINLSMMNIECGYYFPHTQTECTNVDELHKVENLFYAICRNLGTHKFRLLNSSMQGRHKKASISYYNEEWELETSRYSSAYWEKAYLENHWWNRKDKK